MTTEQDNKVSRIKDIQKKIESENSQIQQRILNFQNESKRYTEAFSTEINQSKKKLIDEINSLLNVIDTTTREFEKYKKKTLLSDKDALNTRLDNLLGEITSGVERLQNEIVDLSTKQESEISTIYSQMAGKVNIGLSDIYSAQRKEITNFEKEISSRLEKIQREIISTVESENANQREMTENITSALFESLTEFKTKIHDFSDSKEVNVDSIFAGTMSDSVSRLELAKEDLLAAIDGAMRQLEKNFTYQKSQNEEMLKSIQEAISKGRSDVKDRIEKQRSDLVEEWKILQDEQIKSLTIGKEKASENFQEALETNESFQTNLVSEVETNFKTSLYNEIDNITLSFTKYQDSIINQIDALISRLTSTRDEMRKSLDNLLISNLNKIGGLGRQFEQQLTDTLSQISIEYRKSREIINSNLLKITSDHFNALSSSLDNYKEKTSTKLVKTAADLDVSLMDFFDNAQTDIKEVITKNNASLDKLVKTQNEAFRNLQSGQEKNIDITLTDIKNSLRSRQSELITSISSIAPAAENHVENNRELIEEKRNEITSSSTAAFDELSKQISTIERDGISSIQSIINDTHQKLDNNIKASEKSTKNLIEGLEDNHKNTIAKFRGNVTQELNKNQEVLDKYRTTLKDKFSQFFDNQQESLDHFLDVNRSRRETVDNVRREIDVKFEDLSTGMDTANETLNVNVNTNTQNVTTSVKKILKTVDDVVKSIK
ncbi:MAG: hypothetical protein ACFFAU_12405 [Candidatus Hodarchaeota archaeon]